MDITSYTRVQDLVTSWPNQCLNLYLLKRDKYEFWWILQLPAYQRPWKRRICHYSGMFVVILTMMMMMLLLLLLLLLLQEVGPCWTIVAYTHTLLLPSFFSHWWLSESTTSAVSIYNHMFGFCSCHEYSFGKISLFCSFLSIYYHRQQDTVTASAQQQDGSSTCKTRRSRGSKMRWQYWQDKRCH